MNDELSMEQLMGSSGEIMEILNQFKKHTLLSFSKTPEV